MRSEVAQALAISDESGAAERTVDITTTGRRSGRARRIETWFYRHDGDIYLSGRPNQRPRQWLLNLQADPRLTFHLKRTVIADLPATATVITDPDLRRLILTAFHDALLRRSAASVVSFHGSVEDWIAHSPLARIDFDDDA